MLRRTRNTGTEGGRQAWLLGCGQGERLLTVEELADWLGVPVATIYGWRYRRSGPPSYKVGRHVRFRHTDVEAWLAGLRTEPQPPDRLRGLLSANPVRNPAPDLAQGRAGQRATPDSVDGRWRRRFATPGARSANPRPHPLTMVSDRGRGLGVAKSTWNEEDEGRRR